VNNFDCQILLARFFFYPKQDFFVWAQSFYSKLPQNTTMSASELNRLAVSITAHSWNADKTSTISAVHVVHLSLE